MQKINVLIFPCGSENALEIHSSLKDCVNIEVFGATSKDDHGAFVYKNYINQLPYINNSSFIDDFNLVIDKNNIHIVFPTHDTVALFFAENLHRINARVAVPGLLQAQICRDKSKIYSLFANEDFCPVVYSSKEAITSYPVFVKPNIGEGAKNTRIIKDESDNFWESECTNDFVVSEYLPGDEFTVDCFTDRKNKLRFSGPRKRNRLFAGISVNSFTVASTGEITRMAEIINTKLNMRGLWFFQLKLDRYSKFKLMEISVRASGTMNLYRTLGVNFALLTVYDLLNYDVSVLINDVYLEVDRALFNRYKIALDYHTIYIDFDDTITKNKIANPQIMLFIYNQRNKGKRIKVITRHGIQFDETLNSLGIHKNLFDEVIHITWEDRKYRFINDPAGVIFIDNAFIERAEVKKHLNIPVFDVDAVQCLIDWHE